MTQYSSAPVRKLYRALRQGWFSTADLFAGCGGMSLGFHRAGFRCVLAVERDADAGESHTHNFRDLAPAGQYALHGDIKGIAPSQAVRHLRAPGIPLSGVIDVVVGGPPCQAFSRLGRAALWDKAGRQHAHVDDPRATLYEHFLSYVEKLQPVAFVMENVPEIGRFAGQNVAEEIALAAGDLGYDARYTLLNAAWYGVPQFRERMIIIGIHRTLSVIPEFPVATHTCEIPTGYATSRVGRPGSPVLQPQTMYVDPGSPPQTAKPAVTTSEALNDLPPITYHLRAPVIRRSAESTERYCRHPIGFTERMRRWPDFAVSNVCDGHAVRLTPRDYPLFRRMKYGDMYPEALRIAKDLFKARVRAEAVNSGQQITRRSAAWKRLRAATVPPYKVSRYPNKFRKMNPDEPARTVPAHLGKDCYSHIHYDSAQARTISVREAARLQSFPDGFTMTGSMNARFTQIGNAVPPLLSLAIAQSVRGQLRRAASRLFSPAIHDVLWVQLEPLLKAKSARVPIISDREILNGVVFVLRTGIAWNRLSAEFGWGSGTTSRRRVELWRRSGIWHEIVALLRANIPGADTLDWNRLHARDAYETDVAAD